jgi:hypothetical protein
VHSADVKGVLRVYSIEVPAREKDDLKEDPIVVKLRKVCSSSESLLWAVTDVVEGWRCELRRDLSRPLHRFSRRYAVHLCCYSNSICITKRGFPWILLAQLLHDNKSQYCWYCLSLRVRELPYCHVEGNNVYGLDIGCTLQMVNILTCDHICRSSYTNRPLFNSDRIPTVKTRAQISSSF